MAEGRSCVIGESLANIPWEPRPADSKEPIWRYSGNPVIPRDLVPTSNSIFNSAVVPFEGAFAGVFRVDNRERRHCLHVGFSDDGFNWRLDHEQIEFLCEDEEIRYTRGYDPRVTKIEDRWWVQWCNAYHGPTIGLAWTKDFRTFHQIENALLPFNRNGVLFPRKINGEYVLLSRPSDAAHTAFGDIFLSRSKDMVYWGRHRHVMARGHAGWGSTKIGAGPVPIETREGWLMIYHGVLTSCNGYVYAFSSALLDLEEPWKVIARAKPYLMAPWTQYECVGDVPNVAFPCASLCDADTGRLAIYYGAADTVVALAFACADELIDWTRANDAGA